MSKNFSYENSLTNLDAWISFYYLYGRFPGSEEFVNVPFVSKPVFLKTETNLSPADLYSKFSATDAKGLASLHALAALNIYFGENKEISKTAYGEFMKNLAYQALSQENDNIFLSFDEKINLAHSIVNTFAETENRQFEMMSQISDQLSDKLGTEFEAVQSPAMQIQLGEEPETSQEPKPTHYSTPLTKENIKEIYEKEKTDYLKIAMKLNAIDLELASEVADPENEKLFQEIINPTPGLSLDDEISIDTQISFRSDSDSNSSYTLPDPLKSRLDNILDDARDKINSVSFLPKPIKEIPNDPLYPQSQITTEDIYIDGSLRDLLYPGEAIYFPQPSTVDRKDFEINRPENEMFVFKSPSLTFACIEKKELGNILNRIIEDLDLNLTETLISKSDKTETKQKTTFLKN